MPGRGHPVGGEFDVRNLLDACGSQVGQGFANRHTPRSGRIEQRQRGPLAHRHGFAGVDVVAGGGHGTVGHRHLPGPDHLIARHHAGDAAVADGDQEALAGHGRVVQYTIDRFAQVDLFGGEIVAQLGLAHSAAVHAWRLAEQHIERHVDRIVAEVAVGDRQMRFGRRLTDHCEGATLAPADRLETLKISRIDR